MVAEIPDRRPDKGRLRLLVLIRIIWRRKKISLISKRSIAWVI
jgi:hypothetical protein